jgi:hypothetical protein
LFNLGAVLGAIGALQGICTFIGSFASENLFAYFISGSAFIFFSGIIFNYF